MDPVELTAELIKLDTTNPPGGEGRAADYLAPLLEKAGYAIHTLDLAPGRPNLLASRQWGAEPALMLSGHLDTVPTGNRPWSGDPFSGEVSGGRIHGRGASDMKSGVAAMVAAALELAAQGPPKGGLVLALTAGEEQGCQGSNLLARRPDLLGGAGALLVGEPTANRPVLGHKGSLWLEVVYHGKAAHGSMPHLGDNALFKAAEALIRIRGYGFSLPPHPVLGPVTVNPGILKGGHSPNIVPDRAQLSLDLRTLPGQDLGRLREEMAGLMGADAEITTTVEAGAVWTEPEDPFAAMVTAEAGRRLGQSFQPAGVPYFTDGAALQSGLGGVPTLLLGPGQPEQAHVADEWCEVENIAAARDIYLAVARRWCGLGR